MPSKRYRYSIYETANGKYVFSIGVRSQPVFLYFVWKYVHLDEEYDTAAMAIWAAQETINRLKEREKFPKLLGTFNDGEINVQNIPIREFYHETDKRNAG